MSIADSLYSKDESLQQEKVQDVQILSPGGYVGILGKTYKTAGKNGKRGSIVSDVFLWRRSPEDGSEEVELMTLTNHGDKTFSLRFNSTKEGKPAISGCIFRFRMGDILPSDPSGTQAFFTQQRRKWATLFDALKPKSEALPDDLDEIDWTKVQQSAGTPFSFTIRKDKQYLNLDIDSAQIHAGVKVRQESLLEIYKILKQVQEERTASKASEPSSSSLSDDDLPF